MDDAKVYWSRASAITSGVFLVAMIALLVPLAVGTWQFAQTVSPMYRRAGAFAVQLQADLDQNDAVQTSIRAQQQDAMQH